MSEQFRRLHPDAVGGLTAQEVVAAVPPPDAQPADRPWVALNMIATADGRATIDGHTRALQNRADHELFHALRARADAVLVGAGTVRSEGYGRMEQLAVVVSRSLQLPADIGLLRAAGNRVVVITPSPDGELPACAASVAYIREADMSVALRRLRDEHGVRTVICEGGTHLNTTLLPAGLVDELHLVIAAKLAGGPDPLTILAGPALHPPLELALLSVHESGGYLFLRYATGRR